MLAFASDRVRKRQFWGVLSPICGRYQLRADFFNTLACPRKFATASNPLATPKIAQMGNALRLLDSSAAQPHCTTGPLKQSFMPGLLLALLPDADRPRSRRT